MKRIILILILGCLITVGFSQTLQMTRSGQISFFSKTPMENIEAVNNEVTSLLDMGKGEIVFAVLIKGFHFDRALMEEHFNENYMESTKFPKATFQGKITNTSKIDFTKDGTYEALVEGDLTIHGVKQRQTAAGTITIKAGKIAATSTFIVKLADYHVEIPSLVVEKISKTVEIKVSCQYEPKS
ncbi:MAG: YceI family protein [Cyclobacteriaceae bacterium]|nr:YceI family protein [Cyclobacteriaceae bacterium]